MPRISVTDEHGLASQVRLYSIELPNLDMHSFFNSIVWHIKGTGRYWIQPHVLDITNRKVFQTKILAHNCQVKFAALSSFSIVRSFDQVLVPMIRLLSLVCFPCCLISSVHLFCLIFDCSFIWKSS